MNRISNSLYIKASVFCSIFLMLFANINAQDNFRINSFEAWQPKYVRENNGATAGIKEGQSWQQWCESRIKQGDLGENSHTVWVAYSDRNNNFTYQRPSYDNRSLNKASFGQRLNIAKIQNGFALVFADERKSDFNKGPNSSAKFLGWLPIENLILWEECPKSRSQIYEKALVVYNPEADKMTGGTPRKNPPYILNPSNVNDTSKLFARDLDILFVMKKSVIGGKTFYLLSTQMNFGKDVRSSLLGWLPEEYITEWNQRLVLEPSYSPAALNDYKNRGLKPAAFMQLAEAEKYYKAKNADIMQNAIYTYDNFVRKRMDPLIMRHPIISSTNNDHIFKVAVMTSKGEDVGAGYESKKAEMQREIDDLTKKQQNINVIFVIDATSSMDAFFPAVSNALKDVMQHDFFSNPSTKSYIRVGAVLYRDYKDHERSGGPEIKPLTRDLTEISSYLNKVKVGSIDNDAWEAMYDGLETALDTKKMGYTADQSNFIILIGDAGNHIEYQKKNLSGKIDEIAEKMFVNNINFMGYQINNNNKPAYDEFAVQVGKIQDRLVAKYQNKSRSQMKYIRIKGGFKKVVRENEEDNLPIYILKKDAEPGTKESAQVLTVQVVKTIEEFYTRITDRIVQLRQMSEGGYKISNKAEEGRIREELRMAGWSEGKINSTIQFINGGGVAKFITYAPEKQMDSPFNVYDYVLFFTEKELNDLLRELGKVKKNSSNGAKAYQEAIISMGKAMLGDFSETQLNKMELGDMMAKIYGVPVKIHTTGGKIEDIINKSPEDLKALINDFLTKLETLEYVKNNGAKEGYMFSKNNLGYFWIPLSEVPGFKTSID